MRVVVLHGEVADGAGRDEQDVLVQADIVARALAELGYEPAALPVSLDFSGLTGRLEALRPDFAFNLVESIAGRGSLIHMAPALLDYLNIPFTGAGTEAQFLTSNKLLAKQILRQSGLDTPAWMPCKGSFEGNFTPGFYIIKSVWEHASIGLDEDAVIPAAKSSDLDGAMASRREGSGDACFAEAFIAGREFNLSLLAAPKGPEALPPAEIRFDDYPPGKVRVVGYRAKWREDSFEYQHTRRSFDFPEGDAPLLNRLTEVALKCWRLFRLKGYARVDFRVDPSGKPWILEVNTNPCLSPDGGFHAAAARAGLTFNQVIRRIIADR
jgi:D-alanine-D-alanine ligase